MKFLGLSIKRTKTSTNLTDEARKKAADVRKKEADLKIKELDLKIEKLDIQQNNLKGQDPISAAIMGSDEPGKAIMALLLPSILPKLLSGFQNPENIPSGEVQTQIGDQKEIIMNREQIKQMIEDYKTKYPQYVDMLKESSQVDRAEFIKKNIPMISKETLDIAMEEIENIK